MMDELKWWQKAVFYQIYPRSFADGNGDGIGDLPGIISKLDYLQSMGIDAIWLSPHYPSPLFDCGYDVADYTAVAPEYGTLEDFDRFLAGAHQRGIKVVLDLVLNHTSSEHTWFKESASGKDNPKRDWYIWRPGKNGGPPNNWLSTFGGSAWEYDEASGEYYYHYFFKEQPDLNWRNPEVKEAMFQAVRFWLERGVDGFRLDAIGTIYEDETLADDPKRLSETEMYVFFRDGAPPDEAEKRSRMFWEMFRFQHDLPETHPLMLELRAVVDEYPDRVLIGETDDVTYYGSGQDELDMVFNFPLMRRASLDAACIHANQVERIAARPSGAWEANTLGNHDAGRVISQFCRGDDSAALARLSLALVLTLRGTPFLYNGEEIGMTDLLLTDMSDFRDTLSMWAFRIETEELGLPPDQAVKRAALFGRDKTRTPMQWTSAPGAGFTRPGVKPWLPVNPNAAHGVNVADQEHNPDSLLNFYRRFLALRRATPVLIAGDYTQIPQPANVVVSFARAMDGAQPVYVFLNWSGESPLINIPTGAARPLFSSDPARREAPRSASTRMGPYEILLLNGS